MRLLTDDKIAWIVHETFRAMQAVFGDDMPSAPWFCESRSQRAVTINGVRRVLGGLTAKQNHEQWRQHKANQGYSFGPEKDPENKKHPCMVPWDKLPPHEKLKARTFVALVRELSKEDSQEDAREAEEEDKAA